MLFAIIAPEVTSQKWKESFEKIAPKIKILIGYETDKPEEVLVAMVWRYPFGILSKFPNLQLVVAMGAGVDHVNSGPTLSNKIPICRIVDKQMAFSMSNYIIMAVLNHHRNWYEFDLAQKKRYWAQFEIEERKLKIGVMGIGHLGMDVANKLHHLGFEVYGFSNSEKQTPFISLSKNIDIFLSRINVLICTIPYTPKTKRLLSEDFFNKLKNQTYLINVSRGQIQVEKDIISAINSGKLSGAFLDVFENEPLSKKSPLWDHPKIKITPHIASLTYSDEGVRQVINNFNRLLSGENLINQIDRKKMY